MSATWFLKATIALCLSFCCDLQIVEAAAIKHEKRQGSAGSYDFIIVGGGTAGLALAARLSECPETSILVLEAGQAPTEVAPYKTPGADQQVLGSPIDWAFTTLPQPSLDGRQLTYNRGRCLGGSSAINGLTYGRGSSSVYDLWASLGNEASTTFNAPSDNVSYQGYDPSAYGNGPVQVGYGGNGYWSPGSTAFVESLSSIGVPPVNDLNSGLNVGAKQEPFTIDTTFHRSSAYDNYYMQAKGRPNLKVLTGSPVQKIILQQQGSSVQATGVIYTDYASGATYNVTANKEVIMSAGSFQTPQLLLLSGIGPAATLTKNGIQIYVDNENVGQNLQDHTYFSINVRTQANISASSVFSDYALLQTAEAAYTTSDSGPLTTPLGSSFAFQQLNQSTPYYYETIFYPDYPTPQYTPLSNESYISLTAGLIAPVSRGSVSIKSSSTSDPPVIDLNFYTAQTDQNIAVYAFKQLRTILAQFTEYGFTIGPDNGEVSPGPSVQTDDQILEYIRATAIQVWHASGTCAMLPQADGGVVDSRLRVYGVQRLRIVDTSVFPIIPDQHTQGPTYMLAEKAAQILKEDYGLS